jgi:nucleotide-binding universal stress UspA family protein
MSTTAIVSYDDTLNDHDALALARLLGDAGADLILAYVRHMTEERIDREQVEGSAADSLLERGARWLGDLDVERRVVVNRSTVEGLKDLARQEQAQLIVFGSDYRTAAGHVSPQSSTQKLLDGGPAAIAIAPANYGARHDHEVHTIGLLAGLDDHAAIDTAHALATHFDAIVTDQASGVDLLIVGSRPEAHEGHVLVSAQAQNAIDNATSPVLVVARGVALSFQAPLYVS